MFSEQRIHPLGHQVIFGAAVSSRTKHYHRRKTRMVDNKMTETHAEVGIIGGSGLYELAELENAETVEVETPFGSPSDALVVGRLSGRSVAFVPRHGRGHRLTPTEIPVRANIWALKALGVRQVISISAVGSLREEYRPGSLVVPDQIVDWTKSGRPKSFFEDGIVVHTSVADPYCGRLREELMAAAHSATDTTIHDSGTYICIEGPQFSTRAESELYRFLKMDIIGMTAVPEAKLAREAELCYSALALVTDYDCWRSDEQAVEADLVTAVMARNADAAKRTIVRLVEKLPADAACECQDALAHAIITDRAAVPPSVRERLDLLIGRHLNA
ncbi:S-methyl-5'-thioadenosine phosphorylase [Actinoallomurus iriomotensis]|nr:S-methyl-5'-thioadenosine phosphorylase [Actinoallomurus iriomotensis]